LSRIRFFFLFPPFVVFLAIHEFSLVVDANQLSSLKLQVSCNIGMSVSAVLHGVETEHYNLKRAVLAISHFNPPVLMKLNKLNEGTCPVAVA
jgi:uncharacterized Tic20 family protein